MNIDLGCTPPYSERPHFSSLCKTSVKPSTKGTSCAHVLILVSEGEERVGTMWRARHLSVVRLKFSEFVYELSYHTDLPRIHSTDTCLAREHKFAGQSHPTQSKIERNALLFRILESHLQWQILFDDL